MPLSLGLRGVLALLLSGVWEAVRFINGANASWTAFVIRCAVMLTALSLSLWAASSRRRWLIALATFPTIFLVAGWWDLRQPDTRLAWVGACSVFATLLTLESATALAVRGRGGRVARLAYWVGVLVLAIAGGVTLVILAQVESQFAEEEFFSAVQIALTSFFCLLLLLAQVFARRLDPFSVLKPVEVRLLWMSLGVVSVGTVFAVWSGQAYQASFFSRSAPIYGAVSAAAPFVCASLPPAEGAPDGEQVFGRILALVEANPHKGVPEYGMLASATRELAWAEVFREAILAEAQAGRFTEPANSVKYGQRLAAQRVYYYSQVQAAFPGLFSTEEMGILDDWFAEINRRAMTVEWVDLLYGLAFSRWPEGPYENQENGAGLLALLEDTGLSDAQLAEANRDYLSRDVRGWAQRFRNTDDAYLYQAEWIDNALFQAIYGGKGTEPTAFDRNQRLAFEWLLLQALPGGAPLTYNRPETLSLANTLYLGALLLGDPRYVWAADQALSYLESEGGYLYAQPGVEQPASLTGVAPRQSSCLLFSESGLPTQLGPLAPDKIIFRDGWTDDAIYLLLNLRFTGWHRYKGTNGIVMLYQDGPVLVEESTGQPFTWLPSGRSHFRDKRIPRENLNGLIIPRSGYSQVVYALNGLNGPWAQDPPHHASVRDFYRAGLLDASRTAIDDWRGWDHERTIYFFHGGPVIVVDDAQHRTGEGQGGLAWHLTGPGEWADDGLWLRQGDVPVRMTMSPATWQTITVEETADSEAEQGWDVTYLSPEAGRLHLVTSFLMDGWAMANLEVRTVHRAGESMGQYVRLSGDDTEIRLLHNVSSTPITAQGLSTDGLASIVMADPYNRPHTICALGGREATFRLDVEPRGLRYTDEQTPPQRGRDWEWDKGVLTLWPSSLTSECLSLDY